MVFNVTFKNIQLYRGGHRGCSGSKNIGAKKIANLLIFCCQFSNIEANQNASKNLGYI
jgi:hypothetical protein